MSMGWASHGLINVYGIRLQPKFPINTAKMAYLLLQSIDTIAMKRVRLRVFLELVPSSRTRDLNMPFKLLLYISRTFMENASLHWSEYCVLLFSITKVRFL